MNHNLPCSNLFSSIPRDKDNVVIGDEDMNMETTIIRKETKGLMILRLRLFN